MPLKNFYVTFEPRTAFGQWYAIIKASTPKAAESMANNTFGRYGYRRVMENQDVHGLRCIAVISFDPDDKHWVAKPHTPIADSLEAALEAPPSTGGFDE